MTEDDNYRYDDAGQVIGLSADARRRSELANAELGAKISPGFPVENALGKFLGVLVLLALGLLAAFKVLTLLPQWALGLLIVSAIAFAVFIAVKLGISLIRSFIHRPARTAIGTAVAIGGLWWLGAQMYREFSSINSQGLARPRAIPMPAGTLSTTISRIERNGIVLYQLFSVPNSWSEPVVVPAGFKNIQLQAVPKIRFSVNGSVIDTNSYSPKVGDSLRFMSSSNVVAPTTLRVFMRQPTETELRSVIPLPVLNAQRAQTKK